MIISVEEVRAFISDAKKYRENWFTMADRSWDELKKRPKNRRLWSTTPNSIKKKARYPTWWSIYKIRQPIVLSRPGIPIGRDTTEDGNDPVGACAAMAKERLAKNLAKEFDFFDTICSARDDFLATCFGTVRAYYERTEIKEKAKEYITFVKDEMGEGTFLDSLGKPVETDDIYQEGEQFYIERDEVVDVENECIRLEPILYREIYIDPDIRRWEQCKRLAFECHYSAPEFKHIFGDAAFSKLDLSDEGQDEAAPKRRTIVVYEYWDAYEKECVWLPENGPEFVKPRGFYTPEEVAEYGEDGELNGLYNLERFFPVVKPMIVNQPTDEFWPVPEYYQLFEVFEDIHQIFSRMFALTKAIRGRLLFDNNVEGLEAALAEAAEGDAIGVTNLAQSLVAAGGTLESVVQYIPVKPMIDGLNQLYVALEQRLNTVYKLTGTSDLLQGLITDQTDRTLGERQMLEKYALNQIAEPQRKAAEFCCDCYELLCEMALQNFKDESLDRYIMPQTLPPEMRNLYPQAIQLLKSEQDRFRIELETDSTIALDEEYDKQMRVELVQSLTAAVEKTATIAESSPALVTIELHAMKYLIQGFRQGKMFQGEITEAIDNVIKQAEEAAAQATPPFNKDQVMAQLKQMELSASTQLDMAKMASNERLEVLKLQQADRIAALELQLEAFKTQTEQGNAMADTRIAYEKLASEVMLAKQELALKQSELLLEAQKIADKKEAETFAAMLDARVADYEMKLGATEQALEAYRAKLDMQERYMTEARLQAEHDLEALSSKMDMMAKIKEMQTQQVNPITVTLENAPIPQTKKRFKIKRDENGNMAEIEAEQVTG